uniref:MFS domain-containing protein n=1 Tax=Heterorhabditis bacteriophora TaxID=37862 RepID=A0A1I7X791_HETBA
MDEKPTSSMQDLSQDLAISVQGDRSHLIRIECPRRLRTLRLPSSALHNSHYIAEPSPCTPCSVFSFDLPNSPAVIKGRIRYSRSTSQMDEEYEPTPRSMFSFEFPFSFGSPKTPRTPRTPQTPKSPRTPKTPRFTDLATIEESRHSFSFTVSSIKEQLCADESSKSEEKTTDWTSIRLVMVVILLTRIQFTVYFASLWPFLQEVIFYRTISYWIEEIDSKATSQHFAWINAAYSVGIATSAPLFGYWSNKIGCIRIPSMISMVLMLIMNSMFMFVHAVPGYGRYAMGVARMLAGVAAGGNSLLPTYWTYAAVPEDRSTAAALFDGAFCLGIALGPGFQLLFSPLGYPGTTIWFLQINMYTTPAIVANILVLITFILMLFFFKERPMYREEKRGSIVSTESHLSRSMLPPYDVLAVILCIFAKMVQMFIYANMEMLVEIGSMYTQLMFNLSRTGTTQFNSVLVSLSGFMGFFFLLTYVWTKVGKRIDNRIGALFGILICVGFLLSTYSWWFYAENIESEAVLECSNSWCASTPRIPWWLYSVAYVIVFGVGFAMMNVHLAAMYSQVLGPRRQGTMHGINTLMASCSRVLGPVAVTDLFTHYGPRLVWIFQLSTWVFLLVPFAIFYNRLVPLRIPVNEEEFDKEDLN